MVMAGGGSAALTVVLRFQDQSPAPLRQFNANLQQTDRQLTATGAAARGASNDLRMVAQTGGAAGQQVESVGSAFRKAVPGIASAASGMVSLAVATGLVDSKLGSILSATLAFSSAAASLVPAIQAINRALQTNAALQSFIVSLTRPGIGLALVGAAAVAGVGATAFVVGQNRGQSQVNIDARGARFRSEDDLNELARRIHQGQ